MLDCCECAWKLDKLPNFLTLVTEILKVISKDIKMSSSYCFPVIRRTWGVPFAVGAKTGPASA